jgi:hypothetical protein
VATDTTAGVLHLGDEPDHAVLSRRRTGYAITAILLSALVGAAVVDAIAPFGVYGVDSDTVSASSGGFELEVRYGEVSRPALATPFDIVVRREGGFDGDQVTVAVLSSYLAMWDANGLGPSPAEETADNTTTFWTFDTPDADTLRISFDGRIEPAAQNGEHGRVAVVDDDGTELVAVEFDTRVLP